jgi:class 3 adenylate cyclase
MIDLLDQNGQLEMKAALLYADILGFSTTAARPGARRAVEQLSDVAHLLSTEDSLARYLQRPVWRARYGLSDSIFLVGDRPVEACAAAAEFFFNLAFYNASQAVPVLMRGAITFGEVRQTRAIFPGTALKNLVGEAVVRAVRLERSGAKGPRLLVSGEVARYLKESKLKPLLDEAREGAGELLWLLPPDISDANGLLVGDIAAGAVRLALSARRSSAAFEHYLAYMDLCLRSLLRLRRHLPEEADVAIRKAAIKKRRAALNRVFVSRGDEFRTARQVLSRLLNP